jgi:hypothetical protein
VLTEHGEKHYARHLEQYRRLYPDLHLTPAEPRRCAGE